MFPAIYKFKCTPCSALRLPLYDFHRHSFIQQSEIMNIEVTFIENIGYIDNDCVSAAACGWS